MRNVLNDRFTTIASLEHGISSAASAFDIAFLARQTFGDANLAREVLTLFVEQARRLVPRLLDLDANEQTATAHLLKGSCQGIGAERAADLLQEYGLASPSSRPALHSALSLEFHRLDTAIAPHLVAR